MIRSEAKLRAWGNSIGIILPKEALTQAGLFLNDEVEVVVSKKSSHLKDAFGMLKSLKAKTNKSTEEILREVDEELRAD